MRNRFDMDERNDVEEMRKEEQRRIKSEIEDEYSKKDERFTVSCSKELTPYPEEMNRFKRCKIIDEEFGEQVGELIVGMRGGDRKITIAHPKWDVDVAIR